MSGPAALAPHPAAASPHVPRVARIRKRSRETSDTFTWVLDPAPAGGEPAFAPGQFNMLWLPGWGEVPISISGDPHRGDRLVHTIRAVGHVTNAMAELRPGDAVGVRGPFGRGWPVDSAHGGDLLVVAGGLGLAPLRPAIYHALRHRQRFRRLFLVYGTRRPADVLFRPELERWRSAGRMAVFLTVDRADPSWLHHVGVVTAILPTVPFDPGSTTALVCGPEVMMRFALRELERRGVPLSKIHLSLERNMTCGIGSCGHCQLGPAFVCKDGPVFASDRIAPWLGIREA